MCKASNRRKLCPNQRQVKWRPRIRMPVRANRTRPAIVQIAQGHPQWSVFADMIELKDIYKELPHHPKRLIAPAVDPSIKRKYYTPLLTQ